MSSYNESQGSLPVPVPLSALFTCWPLGRLVLEAHFGFLYGPEIGISALLCTSQLWIAKHRHELLLNVAIRPPDLPDATTAFSLFSPPISAYFGHCKVLRARAVIILLHLSPPISTCFMIRTIFFWWIEVGFPPLLSAFSV